MYSNGLNQPPDDLEASTIYVWDASLSVPQPELDRYESWLSADERDRARRFHFDIHRYRFTAGRGMLRDLLGRYTSREPREIEFYYETNGKPGLRDCGLHFNVSHSEDRAAFTFTRVAPVGADVERVRPLPELMQIAERFFSPLEFQALSALPEAERTPAFFRCWTRKEAIIKTTGEGLSCPLDEFDVSLDATAQVVAMKAPAGKYDLFVYDLGLVDGYIGAVACERPCDRIALLPYGILPGRC